ncbi:anaphase-promoting complex subunit cdc27, partial [Bonamia ostreae]
KQSAETFENLRYVAPHITDALDTYSTVLWQLGRKTELKTLSKFLLNSFGDKPQFLSVAANNFSLQGAHQKSISCLKRATNIDSEYAYGHCLMAFEYLAINALQNAENQFRTCLQIESENYKAFNGLGKASMMREEFKVAAMYFRKAAEINTGNHVLLSHLAEVNFSFQN